MAKAAKRLRTRIINFLLNFQQPFPLTPSSGVLSQNLTVPQRIKKFSAFYGSRRFIAVLTTASHMFLTWSRLYILFIENPFQYHPPIYICVFQVVSFLQVSLPKSCRCFSSSLYVEYAPAM
jgi:hypothetical protein